VTNGASDLRKTEGVVVRANPVIDRKKLAPKVLIGVTIKSNPVSRARGGGGGSDRWWYTAIKIVQRHIWQEIGSVLRRTSLKHEREGSRGEGIFERRKLKSIADIDDGG
jgi:hypothetical protein